MKNLCITILSAFILLAAQTVYADKKLAKQGMNNKHLHELISRIDDKPRGQLGYWQIQYNDIPIVIITDERANRMRIISPIQDANELSKEKLFRMMQANFDSTLER